MRKVDALLALINETRSLFHRLRVVAEQIHGMGEASAGMRGMLYSLASEPKTVVQMARSRPVSRQHIQKMVNHLLREGFVETRPNPKHRRSYLVQLTPRGRKIVLAMKNHETRVFQKIQANLSSHDLLGAAATLKGLREYFEGEEWAHVIQGGRS